MLNKGEKYREFSVTEPLNLFCFPVSLRHEIDFSDQKV